MIVKQYPSAEEPNVRMLGEDCHYLFDEITSNVAIVVSKCDYFAPGRTPTAVARRTQTGLAFRDRGKARLVELFRERIKKILRAVAGSVVYDYQLPSAGCTRVNQRL